MKKATIVLLALLLFTNLSTSLIAFAWNPATSDLSGTGTSTNNDVAGTLGRFNIDSSTAGIQTAEDADSLAFLIKLQASQLLESSPNAHAGIAPVVTDPGFAYDGNTETAATFDCASHNGLFQIITFDTGPGTIVSVDLYVRASVAGLTDDTIALSYTIGGVGETDLWAASSSARTPQDYDFLNLVEPNDGEWLWQDVSDLQINWRTNKASGPDNAVVSVYEVWLEVKGSGFDATAMTADDQYDISFTVGEREFCMLFIATGTDSGTMKLFYKATGEPSWLGATETLTGGTIVSGTPFQSISLNIGFTLTSSATTVGSVKLVVKKTCLASLGATSNAVTGIFASTVVSVTGEPGGGATANDRCPASGGASWILSEAIPDFPFGTLILMLPVISIYIILTRRKNNVIENRFTLLPEHLLNSSKLQYLLVIALLVTIAYSIQRQTSILIGDEEVEAGLIESGDRPALYFKLRNTGDDFAYYTYTVTYTYKRAVLNSSTDGEITRYTSPVVVSPGQTFSYSMRLVSPDQGILDLNLKIFKDLPTGEKLLRDQTWFIEAKR